MRAAVARPLWWFKGGIPPFGLVASATRFTVNWTREILYAIFTQFWGGCSLAPSSALAVASPVVLKCFPTCSDANGKLIRRTRGGICGWLVTSRLP